MASNLPVKQVWAVLFFFMIVILGLDTQVNVLTETFKVFHISNVSNKFSRKFHNVHKCENSSCYSYYLTYVKWIKVCILEGFFTALEDTFPAIRRFKSVSLAITCFIFFIIGIPMVSQVDFHYFGL